MNKIQIIENLKSYIITQLDTMSKNTPIIGFVKPLLSRALNNNINKITSFLDLLADSNGEIDVESIISEMIENVMSANSFILKVPYIGDVNIGNGQIKFNLPMTNKELMLNMTDLENFKSIITSK